MNDLDVDNEQDDLTDWDLYLVDDECLSALNRQQLFRKHINIDGLWTLRFKGQC